MSFSGRLYSWEDYWTWFRSVCWPDLWSIWCCKQGAVHRTSRSLVLNVSKVGSFQVVSCFVVFCAFCCVVFCFAVFHCTVLCFDVLCFDVLCFDVLCFDVLCCVWPCYALMCLMLFCVVLCCVVKKFTVFKILFKLKFCFIVYLWHTCIKMWYTKTCWEQRWRLLSCFKNLKLIYVL